MQEAYELSESAVTYIPIDLISPNPYQPRRYFDRALLEDLSNSIKEFGVIQPITVRLINSSIYELVAGERRLRASKLAGKTKIPAIVININDQESAMIALIENLQRQDLNCFEEAEGFQCLIADYGFTQEKLAQRVGKNQSTVANKLRLLKLPQEVKEFITAGRLTERHARALLRLTSDLDMMAVLKKVKEDDLNVSKTEHLIEKMLESKTEKRLPKIKTYIKDLRIFTNTIKQAVDLMNTAGVETIYEIDESKDGCIITIAVSY